jgi:uncharacterized membrane protein
MSVSYNQIAGRSVERLAALSDGIFAVAMTLLVLDIHAPAAEAIHAERELWSALMALAPRVVVFMTSFLTLGIFWVGQQTMLDQLERSDRSLTWIHLAFLFAVTIVPLSTMVLAEFPRYRVALLAYWFNLLLLGIGLSFAWICATRTGLVRADVPAHVSSAILRRIAIGQGLYALGAALCLVGT